MARRACCCSATRSTRTRSRRRRSSSSAARRDTSRAPGRADRRLRGVHAALPRVVVGARHPLAALDRADGDDLRRPRRQRRLEHLVALGAGDAREALVGGADHRRLHGVLDLPAPRQSLAARARRGADARRSCAGEDDAGPAAPTSSPTSGTASPPRAAGRTTATSATRACSCSTRARRACSPTARREMVDEEEWDWIVEHSAGEFDHLVIASTLPVFLPHGHPPPRGVERGALRRPLGPVWSRR